MNTDISSKRSNLQRRRSLLRNRLPMKYNPYIGWFRHAPPSVSGRHFATSEWQAKERTMKSAVRIHVPPSSHMKASPYIGWFRHAPSSKMRANKRSYAALPVADGTSYHHIQKALKLRDSIAPARKRGKLPQAYVSGRLPGGSPLNEESSDADYGDQSPPTQSFAPLSWLDEGVSESLQRSAVPPYEEDDGDSISSSSTDVRPTASATLGMLNKLASLFLFPLVYDANSYGGMDLDDIELYGKVSSGLMSLMSPILPTLFRRAFLLEDGVGTSEPPRQKRGETCEEGGEHGEDEGDRRDDQAEEGSPNEDSPPDPWKISVSSLAEAYYTHQASNEIAGEGNGMVIYPAQQEGERLDYVITQVDIARMARNASRHLDVESILGLPAVTYRSDQEHDIEAEAGHHQKDKDAAFHDELCLRLDDDDEDSGGWSWMIVPPDPDKADDGAKGKRRSASEPLDGTDRQRQREFCVICLEHFRDGDRLRVLPCDHRFHMGCIDKWLSGTFSDEDCFTSGCPTCKKRPDMISDGGGAREDCAAADGSVPSWAFARLGDALAKET